MTIPILDTVIGFIPTILKVVKDLAMKIIPNGGEFVLLGISILGAYGLSRWDQFTGSKFWMMITLTLMIYLAFTLI